MIGLTIDIPELKTDAIRILEAFGETGNIIKARESLIKLGIPESTANNLIQSTADKLGIKIEGLDEIKIPNEQKSFFKEHKWKILIAILISISGVFLYNKYMKK